MARTLRFEAITGPLPEPLTPDTIYAVEREGQEHELIITGKTGQPYASRRPALQMRFEASGAFVPAGQEIGRYFTTEDLELDALLSGAVSDAPAAAVRSFTVSRGADVVARFTFPAGQSQAIVEILMPTVPAHNLLIFKTPLAQDASLAGVTGTLGARRT